MPEVLREELEPVEQLPRIVREIIKAEVRIKVIHDGWLLYNNFWLAAPRLLPRRGKVGYGLKAESANGPAEFPGCEVGQIVHPR